MTGLCEIPKPLTWLYFGSCYSRDAKNDFESVDFVIAADGEDTNGNRPRLDETRIEDKSRTSNSIRESRSSPPAVTVPVTYSEVRRSLETHSPKT